LRRELAALLCAAAAGCGVSDDGGGVAISVQELDRRLARQQALEAGLDRAPQVAQALEAARGEILARAWRQRHAAAQPRPTREEIAAYYAAHPELFAERRLYSLEEVAVRRFTRAAEELPLELLARLKAMQEGETQLLEDGADGMVMVRLAAARPAPLDAAAAAPLIEKFLAAQRSREALAAEAKRLRAQARIEYLK
jgi:hypothetical protein